MLAVPRSRARRRDDEAGFTLVELLVTVTIMGISFVIILGGIAVFSRATTVQRGSADLDTAMRTYVEQLVAAPYDASCGANYSGVAVPAGYTANIQVKYWDGNAIPAAFSTSCPGSDNGAQQLVVVLTNSDASQRDSLTIVKRP
jgi:prepilin-type N-terminal cleavage/methylation domain-containing protein